MQPRTRVLVIDDDPLFRRLVVSMLKPNFEIFVASDGEEGFHMALEHQPEVALVDIRMPGWDGPRTVRAFRAHRSLHDMKVVILSGYSRREDIMDAIHAGADEYIHKTDCTTENLNGKLEKLLYGRTAESFKGMQEAERRDPRDNSPAISAAIAATGENSD